MPANCDVIVAGCGVMGAAVSRELARRGASVLGLDRYSPPHGQGSSHGRTRLIREAYYEHPLYVPLVRRSYELWRELEGETGQRLLTRTGSIMFGHPDSEIIRGTLRSARHHAVPHEVLDDSSVRRQFPAFTPPVDMVGVHEPGSSLLTPELCVRSLLDRASAAGAVIQPESPIVGWNCRDSGVEVLLKSGNLVAPNLVIATGAWSPDLVPLALRQLQIERQVQHWWTPARNAEHFSQGRMPVSMWQLPDGRIFYTMPDLGDGLKMGWHHNGPTVHPDSLDRGPRFPDHADMEQLLSRFLPDGRGERRDSTVCFYTNTPDGHFILDRHPGAERVWIVSACSGHGFKFAPVIGEIVADLVLGRTPAFDVTAFRLDRFAPR